MTPEELRPLARRVSTWWNPAALPRSLDPQDLEASAWSAMVDACGNDIRGDDPTGYLLRAGRNAAVTAVRRERENARCGPGHVSGMNPAHESDYLVGAGSRQAIRLRGEGLPDTDSPSPEDVSGARERAELVWGLLASLPHPLRTLVARVHFCDDTIEQAGAQAGFSPSRAHIHYRRALLTMRKAAMERISAREVME